MVRFYRSISYCDRASHLLNVCLPVSLPACIKDLICAERAARTKGHRRCYVQANPAPSPVTTAHHPQSPIFVSDGAGFSLSLSVCSFSYVPLRALTRSHINVQLHVHAHAQSFSTSQHYHCRCRYWSCFFKERLPCCQAEVGEAGEKGGGGEETRARERKMYEWLMNRGEKSRGQRDGDQGDRVRVVADRRSVAWEERED